MGLGSKRYDLLTHASGKVLEVSAGTGRNLAYYPTFPKLTALYVTDNSKEMLETVIEKYKRGYRKIFSKEKSPLIVQEADSEVC